MFGAPLVRATVMHHQRRPSASNLPPSSAIHATIMANVSSQSTKSRTSKSTKPMSTNTLMTFASDGRVMQDQAPVTAAKPVSKYAEMDPQMFIDSPFVGGAVLSPTTSAESTASRSSASSKEKANAKAGSSFGLKYFNPSSDPRLLAI